MNYFARRRIKHQAHDVLRHARHMRRYREDVMPPGMLEGLDNAIHQLAVAMHHDTIENIDHSARNLHEVIGKTFPMRSHVGLRENLEVLVVAFAIAMAFRTYFIQPFKIPTGSMQPTLYGIHYDLKETPDFMDRNLLRLVKVAVTGKWRIEIQAWATGILKGPYVDFNNKAFYTINDLPHVLSKDIPLLAQSGEMVRKGQILFAGDRIIGDHLFVDKIRWNLFPPQRGQVMVFKTDRMNMIGTVKTHYIKRMIGLPGDRLQITSPHVLINNERITGLNRIIDQIEGEKNGYQGYCVASPDSPNYCLTQRGQMVTLQRDQYFAMGDNTRNSFDSRYWGPVPQNNLVGPAFIVYWPFSKRFGLIR